MRARLKSFLESLPYGLPAGLVFHLDGYARRHPALAARMLGAGYPSGDFADALHDRLDGLIRAGRPDPALLVIVRGFHAALSARPAKLHFVLSLVGSARRATRARRKSGTLRALWGTTPIINIIATAQADRLLGYEAETVVFTAYRVTQKFDVNFGALHEWFLREHAELLPAFHWMLFAWALLHYDVFHYFNDRGMLPPGGYGAGSFGINLHEMRLLRNAGKDLFTLAYGADHRTRARTLALGKFNFCMHCPEIGKFCVCDDAGASRMLATISRHANAMLASGLSVDYIPNAVNVHYLVVDPAAFKPAVVSVPPGRPLRIGHAPNHPHFKGTQYLVAAVERLQAEGFGVELVMLTGVGNEEVLGLIRSVDVVADQFIGGSYGYFAVEAMALGKPVLCYIRSPGQVIAAENFPVINSNPDTLYDDLRRLIERPALLADLGQRSRRFVEAQLSVAALAERLRGAYLRYGRFDLALYRKLAPAGQRTLLHFLARKAQSLGHWLTAGRPAARRFFSGLVDILDKAYRAARAAPNWMHRELLLPLRSLAASGAYWRVFLPRPKTPPKGTRVVVMVVISDLRRDPRVEREARVLAENGFQVKIAFPDAHVPTHAEDPIDWGPNIAFLPAPEDAGLFTWTFPWLWGGTLPMVLDGERPFAFHGHDLSTALVGLAAARRCGALFVADFHEWQSENVSWSVARQAWIPHGRLKRALSRAVERLVMRQADEVITVCDSIAGELRETVWRREKPVVVLRNIPSFRTPPTRSYQPLREQIGVPGDRFLLLWQGGVGPARMIEPIILALRSAPGVIFVIRGPGIEQFGADYRRLAVAQGVEDRLILLPPVPSQDVVEAAKGADAGIWTLPNACKNFYYALPNKLFEYLAAGLPLLAADFPEARRLVDEHEVGLCFDPYDPQSIAAALRRLAGDTELAARFRGNAPRALARMNAGGEWDKLVELYRGLAPA